MFISLILNPFRGLPGPSTDRHSSGNRDLSWPFARYRHSSFRCCSTPELELRAERQADGIAAARQEAHRPPRRHRPRRARRPPGPHRRRQVRHRSRPHPQDRTLHRLRRPRRHLTVQEHGRERPCQRSPGRASGTHPRAHQLSSANGRRCPTSHGFSRSPDCQRHGPHQQLISVAPGTPGPAGATDRCVRSAASPGFPGYSHCHLSI